MTTKLTNKQTRELLKSFIEGKRLRRYVVRDIVADSDNYSGDTLAERIKARLEDVSMGCSTGIVSGLVYWSDTEAFYKKFKREIIDLARETADSMGESLGAFLSGLHGWEDDDPFCEEGSNRNTLAWFAYEEIAFELGNEIENAL